MIPTVKGYHTGEQLKQCHENGIITYVSPKAPATKDIGLHPNSDFVYDFGVGQEHCHFPVKNTASLKYDYSNN